MWSSQRFYYSKQANSKWWRGGTRCRTGPTLTSPLTAPCQLFHHFEILIKKLRARGEVRPSDETKLNTSTSNYTQGAETGQSVLTADPPLSLDTVISLPVLKVAGAQSVRSQTGCRFVLDDSLVCDRVSPGECGPVFVWLLLLLSASPAQACQHWELGRHTIVTLAGHTSHLTPHTSRPLTVLSSYWESHCQIHEQSQPHSPSPDSVLCCALQ